MAKRPPEEIIINAQIYLLRLRKTLAPKNIEEWMSISEACLLLDKCLKEVKSAKKV